MKKILQYWFFANTGSSIPSNAMLWDDGSPMLWDDGSYMLWD